MIACINVYGMTANNGLVRTKIPILGAVHDVSDDPVKFLGGPGLDNVVPGGTEIGIERTDIYFLDTVKCGVRRGFPIGNKFIDP